MERSRLLRKGIRIMANLGTVAWPFEFEGWRITFHLIPINIGQPANNGSVEFRTPHVEHLHEEEQQLVRWCKKRKPIDIKKFPSYHYEDGPEEEEQLCCFVCAEYMPKKVYEHFMKCKEMAKCSM